MSRQELSLSICGEDSPSGNQPIFQDQAVHMQPHHAIHPLQERRKHLQGLLAVGFPLLLGEGRQDLGSPLLELPLCHGPLLLFFLPSALFLELLLALLAPFQLGEGFLLVAEDGPEVLHLEAGLLGLAQGISHNVSGPLFPQLSD